MLSEQILYWIWLARACGVASKNFVRLIERFETPFDIYSLGDAEIEYIEGIGNQLKNRLSDKNLEPSYSVLKFCKKNRVDIITYGDKRYPLSLKRLEDPPAVLFCRGRFPDFNTKLCVAVVGTRKMSEYGKQAAYKIAYEMAAANAIIVSGMAFGNDGVASAGALAAGGDTVAVLGSGIDVVYPKEHTKLYEKIARSGAVITEFMPSTPPDKYNFPMRNRIISGLCQATLVVEGDHRSGSLITARTAIMQGREVFALPGEIYENNSEGPNELIRSGAYAALGADDIINHYDFLYHDVINYRGLRKAKSKSELDEEYIRELNICWKPYKATKPVATTEPAKKTVKEEEVKVREAQTSQSEDMLAGLDDSTRRIFLQMPMDSAVSPDRLVEDGYTASDVITALTMLELCGLVTSLPGGLYIRK